MNNILLYTSIGMIVFSFICYCLIIIIGRRKVVSKDNSFDITKDMISEYNSINIIESKKYFTVYNIKRKVIKLDSRSYYGKDLSSISLSLIEAAISIVDNNKNKYINIFRKIFSNLKILYLFPLISILINLITYNVSDAKVSIIFVLLISVITYIFVDIKIQSVNWIKDNIKKIKSISKVNAIEIIGFINKLILLDKMIFVGELIMIVRFVSILLEIK